MRRNYMELNFSQRYGYKSVKNSFQIDDIDEDLKIGIWNVMLDTCFQGRFNLYNNRSPGDPILINMCRDIWVAHFKLKVNEMPSDWYDYREIIEDIVFNIKWYEIYDLLEFVAKNIHPTRFRKYKEKINLQLEKEMAGYRLVNREITPITSSEEIQTIEDAINQSDLKHVAKHIESALDLMSDRDTPDYRNSIKESISAVEGIAKMLTKDRTAELKTALNKLDGELEQPLHGALKSGFLKIYGYTSDGDGIRHALTEESSVSFEDAKFMLVACSAFVNYLLTKAKKANIEIN